VSWCVGLLSHHPERRSKSPSDNPAPQNFSHKDVLVAEELSTRACASNSAKDPLPTAEFPDSGHSNHLVWSFSE
jgi:hypothetical protein